MDAAASYHLYIQITLKSGVDSGAQICIAFSGNILLRRTTRPAFGFLSVAYVHVQHVQYTELAGT